VVGCQQAHRAANPQMLGWSEDSRSRANTLAIKVPDIDICRRLSMTLPGTIRRLSYNRKLRNIARRLHIGRFARRVYCRLLSGGGALQISCLGVSAVFKTNNSNQLAFVDCIFTTEREVIEATLCKLRPGDVFLDVGCHYGIYSVLASKLVGPTGRVVAVEPHPATLEVLRENLAFNNCLNVEVLNLALSDKASSLALAFNENGSHRQRETDPLSAVHNVPAIAGDDFLNMLPVPSVIKIDVEGHEFAVLSGLQRTLSSPECRMLCLEIHPQLLPKDVTERSILKYICDCGFCISSQIARAPEVHVIAVR
jgi:FkbM family methyltransferase